MTYRGRVKRGVIVIDGGGSLPEGTQVEIESPIEPLRPTHAEIFANIIDKAVDLPEDFAENHDRYIHGAP